MAIQTDFVQHPQYIKVTIVLNSPDTIPSWRTPRLENCSMQGFLTVVGAIKSRISG